MAEPDDHSGEHEGAVSPLAGLSIRLVAATLDAFAVLVVALVMWALLLAVGVSGDDFALMVHTTMAFAVLVVQVPGVARTGQTPGMTVLGVRVQVRGGAQPLFTRAVVRAAVLYGPALVPLSGPVAVALGLWPLLCFSVAAFDRERRGVHDRLAGTVVHRLPRMVKAAS